MKLNYNVTGEDRKKLVKLLSEVSGYPAVYLRAPTMAYEVGPYTVSKTGAVEVDPCETTIDNVFSALSGAGFNGCCESFEGPSDVGSITISRTEPEPMDDKGVENLRKIIDGKADLILKAFGITDISIQAAADRIVFRWFPDMDHVTGAAYCEFVSALCRMARDAKRVTMKNAEVENDKYAWRCFLLRLGFIGPEYKETRKVLMKNFSGSSAYKHKKEKTNVES